MNDIKDKIKKLEMIVSKVQDEILAEAYSDKQRKRLESRKIYERCDSMSFARYSVLHVMLGDSSLGGGSMRYSLVCDCGACLFNEFHPLLSLAKMQEMIESAGLKWDIRAGFWHSPIKFEYDIVKAYKL